jgi:hypothetical protein
VLTSASLPHESWFCIQKPLEFSVRTPDKAVQTDDFYLICIQHAAARTRRTPRSFPASGILVVDDEPNILDVISMALRFQGFRVDTAENGRAALAAVRSFQPHLMLLDIMLPDMEGFEVARRLGVGYSPRARQH